MDIVWKLYGNSISIELRGIENFSIYIIAHENGIEIKIFLYFIQNLH